MQPLPLINDLLKAHFFVRTPCLVCYNLRSTMEVSMENDTSPVDKVVALPFPIYPRRVIYGRLAKVIDFLAWKKRMGKTNGEAENDHSETLEDLKKMSPEAQKLWLIKKILK